MKDGPIRRLVKSFARTLWTIDLTLIRSGLRRRGRPFYRLEGTCNGCGMCCVAPTIRTGLISYHIAPLRGVFLWWQRIVNGFELVGRDPDTTTFTFRCTHYDPETKQCDSYASRPGMCRDYPRNLTYSPVPYLFDECSHEVIHKDADRFRQSLQRVDLPEAQRLELERKLNLRARHDDG